MTPAHFLPDHLSRPDTAFTHASYHLDVTGAPGAAALSVVSWRLRERLGRSWRLTLKVTHPEPLVREDFLGKDATFTLAPAPGESIPFDGWISGVTHLSTSRDLATYRVVVEAHLARLSLTPASRIFQKQTAPQIIEALLRRHGLLGHQFVFRLRRTYPEHAFRLQYRLSDGDYLRVLMEQEGIYSFYTAGEHGDVLVFADDVDHYQYQPTLTVPYREAAGLEANDEALLTLATHATTAPQSIRVADYHPERAWERFEAEANLAAKDATTYGQPYVYGTGHQSAEEATWEAQLRHEAALAAQIVYAGTSTHPGVRCARVVHTGQILPDAPHGMVITEVTHRGARDTAYRNHFKAIPADRRFRLPLNEDTWPRIGGTLSARVTSPGQYPYAHLTAEGYYVVRFDLDFDPWSPGGESVPLRLAKPFAGKLQTGMHFPALDGDEAVIAFRDSDPNKPYIAGFHHHSQARDLITHQDRWMSRNVIRTQSDNKLQMEDWRGEEHIKLSTEHSGKSQLSLGHLVDGKRQARGEGFELRTSAHGALRAGKGLLISTHDRAGAAGKQRDAQEAMAQLRAAHEQMAVLAQAADAAKADAADAKAMNAVLQTQFTDLQQQVMLLASQSSIALTSPDTIQHSAGKQLTFTAGGNADVGVLRRFTVAAGEAISLFAQKAGMKLFARQGKIDIQAQGDALALAALKDLTITSANGKLILSAKKEVWIGAGGSYIKINACRIESGTAGDIYEKCAMWEKQAPGTDLVKTTVPGSSPLPDLTRHGGTFSD